MLTNEQMIELTKGLQLHSERLTLRPFKGSDMALEVKQSMDLQVVQYIREPLSFEAAVEHFQSFMAPWQANEDQWLGFCVVRKSDGETVGTVSFRFESLASEIVELGYRFVPAFQGKGYATEAAKTLVDFVFSEIGVHKVMAICDPRNIASYKLMEKLGMQQEGLLRQHYKIGELRTDELIYGLLHSEWRTTCA
jgi:RimJ/RimL family protein N-acetyltransferase